MNTVYKKTIKKFVVSFVVSLLTSSLFMPLIVKANVIPLIVKDNNLDVIQLPKKSVVFTYLIEESIESKDFANESISYRISDNEDIEKRIYPDNNEIFKNSNIPDSLKSLLLLDIKTKYYMFDLYNIAYAEFKIVTNNDNIETFFQNDGVTKQPIQIPYTSKGEFNTRRKLTIGEKWLIGEFPFSKFDNGRLLEGKIKYFITLEKISY